MRTEVAALVCLLAGCEPVEPLACVDGAACVDLGDQIVLVDEGDLCGVCAAGKYDCAADACLGFLGPTEEVCNGLDDDCDCAVDNAYFNVPSGSPDNPCLTGACGVCRDADYVCRDGQMVCTGQPLDEVCNGVDDDCDCEVDEIPVEFTYTGPPATAGVGECRPQVTACIDGAFRVVPEVLPSADLCGDLLDNDCDGTVDENTVPAPLKSLFLDLDTSGSMADRVEYAAAAICLLAEQRQFWVAIALVASTTQGPSFIELLTDFVDEQTACQMLQGVVTGPVGSEYMLDPWEFAPGLAWPTDDRTLVVMTDESIQIHSVDEARAAEICQQVGFDLLVSATAVRWPEWDGLLADCGGERALLTDAAIFEALDDTTTPLCVQDVLP